MTEGLLLTVRDVQRELSLGRTVVYEMIRSGELPCVHIGAAVRVPREALAAWVEARTSPGTEPAALR
jgi:excisionase family DNA binding protein